MIDALLYAMTFQIVILAVDLLKFKMYVIDDLIVFTLPSQESQAQRLEHLPAVLPKADSGVQGSIWHYGHGQGRHHQRL